MFDGTLNSFIGMLEQRMESHIVERTLTRVTSPELIQSLKIVIECLIDYYSKALEPDLVREFSESDAESVLHTLSTKMILILNTITSE